VGEKQEENSHPLPAEPGSYSGAVKEDFCC